MRKNATKTKKTENNVGVIPDYDWLFSENKTKQGRKKSAFMKNILVLNRVPIVFSLFIFIIQCLPVYVTPIITAEIINLVTNAISVGQITNQVINKLIFYAIVLLLCLLQNVPTTRLRFMIVSKMLRRTSAGIKASVVRRLQSLSLSYHKDMETGRIQAKFIKDTEEVDAYLSQLLTHFIPNVLSTIIYIGISIYNNGVISLFFLFLVPLNVFVGMSFKKKIRKSNHAYRVNAEVMSARLNTMLEMIPVTKSHGLEQTEIYSVENSIKEVAGAGIEVDKNTANFGAWMYVVPHALSALCLIFCSVIALYGYISVGEIVLFQSIFTALSGYITSLVNAIPMMSKGAEAVNSISEIMNAKEVEININKTVVPLITGKIDFESLSYRYSNRSEDTIKDLSLSVKEGECIAVVGSSGSGKTTLMNLIIGFMMPTDGDLKIDGKSIKDINLTEYRHNISVVPQNSILFNGTIRDNITYGLSHYSDQELDKVIEMANLKEFISQLPQGVDTVIGEHGGKLSGGQKQRITIARALIRNPKILILDEATSALDNLSEYYVQKAISSSIKGRTTFIVAHRLSTIRNADRIVVLEEGKIVEQGTYEQLLEKKGKFYQLKRLNDAKEKEANDNLA